MLAERLHHVAVAVTDLEGAVAWYAAQFGLAVEKRFALPEAHLEIVKLRSPAGVGVELLRSSREGVGPRAARELDEPGAQHVCFAVDDVEAVAAEARRRGIRLLQEPKVIAASREKNCWIADPEGNPIEFIEDLG